MMRSARSLLRPSLSPLRPLFSSSFLSSSSSLFPLSPSLPFPSSPRFIHGSSSFDPNPDSTGARVGEVVITTKHGHDLLLDPLLNKGTAFNMEERERMGVRGLVPPGLPKGHTSKEVMEWQKKRIMSRFNQLSTNISKYTYLMSLQDRNEVLFYRCLVDNLEELAPIVYTPTVGAACLAFSSTVFRRPRGMYFSAADKGHMHAMSFNWQTDDVELIVVTDGSRILGLGDLSVNGMSIPIGKLVLYSAGAGIHPSRTLPVVIDVGTNNPTLLSDPMYLGLQQKRLVGSEYYAIVDEFIRAVSERFPKALIQFEDFSNENAANLLHKYRNKVLCFNDDIQGTATVTLAGILGALRAINPTGPSPLSSQRFVVAGAGSAGLGVASGIKYALMSEGLSEEEARKRFFLLDHKGALGKGRKPMNDLQRDWIRDDVEDEKGLEALIEEVKPTVLLGLTGTGQLFTEKALRSMARHCPRPIIFPLSNPTDNSECTAEQAYEWTDGRAIVASGSPFPTYEHKGKKYRPSQCNNFYTFPGIGLGALVSRAKYISDGMLYAVARALAECVGEHDLAEGRIFPNIQEIPNVSKHIAFCMTKQAMKEGLNRLPYENDEEIKEAIRDRFWEPSYGSMVRVDSVS